MAEIKYESKIGQIAANDATIFAVLSNLENINRFRDAIPQDKIPHYLGIISGEVKRLSRLVSSLLDITKIQAGERKFNMAPFDICEMAREIIISSEQRLEDKRLDVEFDADRDNMFVNADRDAIHQVLYNLCDNGIKFARESGKYAISIKEIGSKIEVSVFNEGEGITPEDVPFVFDRFYKSDRSRGLDKTGVQKHFKQTKGYTIPYRCLIPEAKENLLLCGRNISGTHMAHSNFRVMPICVGIGEAAGAAAYISALQNRNLNDIDAKQIREITGI